MHHWWHRAKRIHDTRSCTPRAPTRDTSNAMDFWSIAFADRMMYSFVGVVNGSSFSLYRELILQKITIYCSRINLSPKAEQLLNESFVAICFRVAVSGSLYLN